jgi:hypothetical protein
VTTLPEAANLPLVEGSLATIPIEPVCSMVVGHVHPPSAAAVQLAEL